ncbi:MAG TPA: hypothetical protein VFV38_39205 [Ktedonobacteraceae bacterium]|nr:hypothetical protein [Ktedonobacteraceae bacterium]
MEGNLQENALEGTAREPLAADDYSPMRASDNPLVALAEQLGYRISSRGHGSPSGHHVQCCRGEDATVTIYENDLLKLVFQLIEHTQSVCSPEGLAKQQY